jgi:biofilm PGA synthesis N-glycosyltransferase PgaC
VTTLPLTERPAIRTEPATGTGEFRSSAAFPLPRLRTVADFVALPSTKRHVTVQGKFGIALAGAAMWLLVAIAGSVSITSSLAAAVTWPLAIFLLLAVVAVPGFFLVFMLLGFVLDHPPTPAIAHPTIPITVIITARNQPRSVVSTLAYLRAQDYDGPMSVLLVDNGSTDATIDEARRAATQLGIELRVVVERRPGVVHARNTGFACADHQLAVLLDAGTALHPSAVRLLVARLLRSSDTAAVSAHALVRNTRHGDRPELEAHDYSLQVHASQRVHGLFQAPLVTEGSCSIYRTDAVRAVNGWALDDADGVMLTWRFLVRGWRVFHEPLAVAFTSEAVTMRSWAARRARAAQSIRDAARENGLSSLRFRFNRFVTLIGAAGPMLDVIFTVGLGLALFLGLFGSPALLGLYLLLVLPVSLTMSVVVRRAAHAVMDDVGLVSVRGPRAWLGACIGLHVVQAPLGAWSMVARTVGRRS